MNTYDDDDVPRQAVKHSGSKAKLRSERELLEREQEQIEAKQLSVITSADDDVPLDQVVHRRKTRKRRRRRTHAKSMPLDPPSWGTLTKVLAALVADFLGPTKQRVLSRVCKHWGTCVEWAIQHSPIIYLDWWSPPTIPIDVQNKALISNVAPQVTLVFQDDGEHWARTTDSKRQSLWKRALNLPIVGMRNVWSTKDPDRVLAGDNSWPALVTEAIQARRPIKVLTLVPGSHPPPDWKLLNGFSETLEEFRADRCPLYFDEALTLFPTCHHLRDLEIHVPLWSGEKIGALVMDLATHCPELRSLDIDMIPDDDPEDEGDDNNEPCDQSRLDLECLKALAKLVHLRSAKFDDGILTHVYKCDSCHDSQCKSWCLEYGGNSASWLLENLATTFAPVCTCKLVGKSAPKWDNWDKLPITVQNMAFLFDTSYSHSCDHLVANLLIKRKFAMIEVTCDILSSILGYGYETPAWMEPEHVLVHDWHMDRYQTNLTRLFAPPKTASKLEIHDNCPKREYDRRQDWRTLSALRQMLCTESARTAIMFVRVDEAHARKVMVELTRSQPKHKWMAIVTRYSPCANDKQYAQDWRDLLHVLRKQIDTSEIAYRVYADDSDRSCDCDECQLESDG